MIKLTILNIQEKVYFAGAYFKLTILNYITKLRPLFQKFVLVINNIALCMGYLIITNCFRLISLSSLLARL